MKAFKECTQTLSPGNQEIKAEKLKHEFIKSSLELTKGVKLSKPDDFYINLLILAFNYIVPKTVNKLKADYDERDIRELLTDRLSNNFSEFVTTLLELEGKGQTFNLMVQLEDNKTYYHYKDSILIDSDRDDY